MLRSRLASAEEEVRLWRDRGEAPHGEATVEATVEAARLSASIAADSSAVLLREEVRELRQELQVMREAAAATAGSTDATTSDGGGDDRQSGDGGGSAALSAAAAQLEALREQSRRQFEEIVGKMQADFETHLGVLADQRRAVEAENTELRARLSAAAASGGEVAGGDRFAATRLAEAEAEVARLRSQERLASDVLRGMGELEERCSELKAANMELQAELELLGRDVAHRKAARQAEAADDGAPATVLASRVAELEQDNARLRRQLEQQGRGDPQSPDGAGDVSVDAVVRGFESELEAVRRDLASERQRCQRLEVNAGQLQGDLVAAEARLADARAHAGAMEAQHKGEERRLSEEVGDLRRREASILGDLEVRGMDRSG